MPDRNTKIYDIARLLSKFKAGKISAGDFESLMLEWLEHHQWLAYQAVIDGHNTSTLIAAHLEISKPYASTLLNQLWKLSLLDRERTSDGYVYRKRPTAEKAP